MEKIRPPHYVLWVTFFLFCVAFVGIGIASRTIDTKGIDIETDGQPTIGYSKAPVHVVVFEEPKCPSCRDYSLEVFPKIKKEFIDTHKVRYTFIPVSFLPGSMPAAVAFLGVYNNHPDYPDSDLFFTYVDYIYEHQPDEEIDWAKTEALIDFAKQASPAIEIDPLKTAIEKGTYRVQIEKNTTYGQGLMDGSITTPTVYVNGVKANDLSYDTLARMIRQALESKGVY